MSILPTYLSHTLVPALHEQRIKTTDDAFRVSVRDEGKSGTFVYINLMGHGDTDYEIVATPGFDGYIKRILWQVNHEDGDIVDSIDQDGNFHDECGHVDVQWTGDVKYDTTIYLQAMRNVIIDVMRRMFPPPMTKTIVMLDGGDSWGICAYKLDITDEEYERLSEGDEKIRDVVPNWQSRCDPV